MRRALKLSGLVATALCAIALPIAGTAAGGNGATTTKGHFEYDLFDEHLDRFVHFSCDEVRVEVGGGARETIHCKTDDRSNKSAVVFSPDNLFSGLYPWSSDFNPGQEAVDFHLAGTPSGNLDGWATY